MNCECFYRVSIYHGTVELVNKIDTNVEDIFVQDFEETLSKLVEFDITVKKLPKNARLCFGLYEKDKKGNNRLVGWTNRTIFDFKGNMRKPFSMYFWNCRNHLSSHELLNPYKSSEEINKGKNTISMEVKKYSLSKTYKFNYKQHFQNKSKVSFRLTSFLCLRLLFSTIFQAQ